MRICIIVKEFTCSNKRIFHSIHPKDHFHLEGDISVGGTSHAKTTLTSCTPFFRMNTDCHMFLTTTDTLLLLILSLVYVCRTCNPGSRGCAPRLSFPSPQGCHHNVLTFTNEWFDHALQYLGLEWSQSNILFHEDWLVHRLNKWDALTIAQGVESLFISLSLITLMILPSVQVPIMIGTCWENSDSSDTTRKTMSSS